MPEFYPDNRDEATCCVHITFGPDPIIVHCSPDVAERLVDAREISKLAHQGLPANMAYDAKLVLFLSELVNKWPLYTPPTESELCKILNYCRFYTFSGKEWQRMNLHQKLAALNFDRRVISNPKGGIGSLFAPPQVEEHLQKFDELLIEEGVTISDKAHKLGESVFTDEAF